MQALQKFPCVYSQFVLHGSRQSEKGSQDREMRLNHSSLRSDNSNDLGFFYDSSIGVIDERLIDTPRVHPFGVTFTLPIPKMMTSCEKKLIIKLSLFVLYNVLPSAWKFLKECNASWYSSKWNFYPLLLLFHKQGFLISQDNLLQMPSQTFF